MEVLYFEIEESFGAQCNIWYVPYENIPNYAFHDLENILDQTNNFRLGDIKLKHGKDFRLPSHTGSVHISENTFLSFTNTSVLNEEGLEKFIKMFNIKGKDPKDLDKEWAKGNIHFIYLLEILGKDEGYESDCLWEEDDYDDYW